MSLRFGRPPRELLKSLTANEFNWLWVYHQISPIDDSRGDIQAAIIASTMARCFGNSDAKPMDFMPFERKKEVTAEEQFHALSNMLERSRG